MSSQASNSGTYNLGMGHFSNAAYGDLATGKLGAATFATDRFALNVTGARSQWVDDVQFDFAGGATSREIFFSYLIDGLVAPDPASTSGFNYGHYEFNVVAFSGRDPIFGNLIGFLGAVRASAYIYNPTTVTHSFQVNGCVSSVAILPNCQGSTVGKLTSINTGGLTGSFLAKEGEYYEITAALEAHGTADFLNTGTFRFNSLGTGTTMQSASGAFLSNIGAVPEPSTWAMMIVGFGAAGLRVRGSRSRLAALAAA